ncbi:uncharacterized protein G2W53_011661 [Senna tora]|uniref:Hydroxyproline-rich glycoprotein family protein n=1 Tax=Senna tora TaxID=362788 RepID=A0A834X390_9FABA|nr:uncharacterized protein G2W53_011661 [Senna tora]
MKTSLRKLRGFSLHKHDDKERRDVRPLAQLDELAQATQARFRSCFPFYSCVLGDMQDMRECYDSLFSAAAATANSAYEFAESLRELGSCLLEKTALNDDEESGTRSHISQTITSPSESLLNELQTVEEMKQQCDEKRELYEYMMARYRERGSRSRGGKGESVSLQQLQMARDEYDEEATLFVFRLKSLKQGQSRSLLTQAARHHAAQLDQEELTFRQGSTVEAFKENLGRLRKNSFSFRRRAGSQSAPIFADSKPDSREKLRQMRPSLSRKFNSYVLPTPVDGKSEVSSGSSNPVPSKIQRVQASLKEPTRNLWHSSPLEQKKHENIPGDEKFSGPTVRNLQSVLKESNSNTASTRLPPPLVDSVVSSNHDFVGAYSKRVRRQAFSGPLTSKPWPTKPVSVDRFQLFSGPILRTPTPQPPSPPQNVSPSASPTFTSSPKISELHELPRPPASFQSSSSRPLGLVGYSGPLVSRSQKLPAVNKLVPLNAASPLPTPPQAMPRSFSIPSNSARVAALHEPRPLEAPRTSSISEDIASPPLTPITLPLSRPLSDGSASETVPSQAV